jgi:hypothetical protein
MKFNIDFDRLEELEQMYFVNQAKAKMAENPSQWDETEANYINAISFYSKKSEPLIKKEI